MLTYDEIDQQPLVRDELPSASLWGAGFRQGNAAYNLYELVTREQFAPDPTFDFKARAMKSPLYSASPDSFFSARSEDEFSAIERRVAQEQKDRNTLAAGGILGFGAAVFSGLLSPEVLLPAGALAKGAGALKSAVSVGAWSVVGVGTQEVVLQAAQETRTGEETAFNLAGAAVLGGILGGAIGYLGKKEVARLASGMADGTVQPTIQFNIPAALPDDLTDTALGSTVGAKQLQPGEIPPLFGESAGGLAPSFKIGELAAHQSPVTRNLTSISPSVRQLQAQISSGGVRLAGNAQGIAGAPMGAIEDRIGQWKAKHATALFDTKKAFAERAVRSMDQRVFNEEVGKVLGTGIAHSDPAVNAAAESWRRKFYTPFFEEAKKVGMPGFDEITEDFADQYLNRSLKKELARQNANDLLQILFENSLEKLNTSLQKRMDAAVEAARKASEKADVLEMPATDIAELRKQFEIDMKMLPEQFPPEIGNVASEIRALRAEARLKKGDKELAKALRAEADALEEANKETLAPFRSAERKLKSKFKMLDETYSALTERQERTLTAIDELERMQLDSLESVARQGQKLLNKLDKGDADFRGSAEAFEARVERSLDVLEKAEARQAKLDPADASEFEATVAKRRIEFAENLAAMNAAKTASEMREAVQQTLDDLLVRVRELNAKRTLRIEKLREAAAKFDPKDVAKRAAELRKRAAMSVPEVLAKANEAGARIVDGKADYTELARQHAQITYNHLIGNDHRAPGYGLLLERGPELARTLDIDPMKVWSNGKSYGEFLDWDIGKQSTRYFKTMAADIEIQRKFGTLNPLARDDKAKFKTPIMEQIYKEFADMRDAAATLPEGKKQKRLAEISKAEQAFLRDTGVQLDRLRHLRGIPDDPNGFFFRAGRVASNLNTLRLLGRMALASVPDLARPIMKVGLLRAFGDSFGVLASGFAAMKLSAEEVRSAGVAVDLVLHSRTAAMLDVFTDIESGTRGERALQHATSRIGYITLMDQWNTMMQQWSGALLNMKMMRAIESTALGKAKKGDITFLAENNIDSTSAQLIWRELQRDGGSTRLANGVLLPNSESWSHTAQGIAARDAYRTAIYKAVNDTVIVPGVERPNWVDSSMTAKLIAQFRSFTLSATTKILVSNAQALRSGDMAPVIGSIFSLALGAFSYYTWATLRGGEDRTKMQNADLGTWADEAIRRSGLLAALSEVVRIGDEVPGVRGAINLGPSANAASWGRKPLVEALGPTIGLLDTAGDALVNLRDKPERTVEQTRKLMPLQNHFILSHAFDAVEDYLKGVVQ